MSIYTRNGDEGKTSLINEAVVSKSDDRIELLGTIDELSSYIGFAKVLAPEHERNILSEIFNIMAKNGAYLLALGIILMFLANLIHSLKEIRTKENS